VFAVFLAGAAAGASGESIWRELRNTDDFWRALISLRLPLPAPTYIHRQDTIALSLMTPKVVMLGDSLTQEAAWVELTGCPSVANFGIGGDTTKRILQRLRAVVAVKPRAVLLMAGTNDISQGVALDDIAANLAQILELLDDAGIVAFMQQLPPIAGRTSAVAELNRRILARSRGTISIPFELSDLRSDGVHLNAAGYAKWRAAIAPVVGEYCN
jgi:lysophospholipase L1-like esterase